MQFFFWKIIIYQSFIDKLSSVQPDFSTKHTTRVKPSQYIAQHLYEQTRKNNCSSCCSQTSYYSSSKVFSITHINQQSRQIYKLFVVPSIAGPPQTKIGGQDRQISYEKLLIISPKFFSLLPTGSKLAQISNIFHKNLPPRNFSIMILAASKKLNLWHNNKHLHCLYSRHVVVAPYFVSLCHLAIILKTLVKGKKEKEPLATEYMVYIKTVGLFFSGNIMFFYILHFLFFQVQYIHCWKHYIETLRRNFCNFSFWKSLIKKRIRRLALSVLS
jgi:hypothetical protein